MLKTIKIIMVMIAIFTIPYAVMAADVDISKTTVSQVNYGENLVVKIEITNNKNTPVTVNVKETVVGAQAVEPQLTISQSSSEIRAAVPPYFEWSLGINANSKQSISYTIKPNKVGTYSISPTTVMLADGTAFFSNDLSVEVLCNQNNVCESDIGENYLTCSQDCKTGGSDNICNPARDNICDSDCEQNVDLDCLETTNSNDIVLIGGGVIILLAAGFLFLKNNNFNISVKKKKKR